MRHLYGVAAWAVLFTLASSLPYDPEQVLWNLNQNQTAKNVLDYWGEWPNHTYHPSPENWRFPFYTLFLDRFVNGDPSNDDANGTVWEHDMTGTQLRHGGDVKGLQDTLDYLAGMGIKGIYLAGSPMINLPWGSDGFSPLDFTLLDPHFATIAVWRECIAEMHSRGMYVIFDNTMGTLGDLIGFEGFLNVSTPFDYGEHNALWKGTRRYFDFDFDNTEIAECDYPRWWGDDGLQVIGDNGTEYFHGCRDSDFDQYGDIYAFGQYPEWQRQISKFGSVQDRLREWKPSVRERIEHLSCIQIAMLDIDGFRMDKGEEITVDAQGEFADYIRECAISLGKKNFFIPGEIVSGSTFGNIYLGRGKEPSMAVNDTNKAVRLTSNTSDDSLFVRSAGKNAFDAACFSYSIYRSLTRFLGMDGPLSAAHDTPVDFVETWQNWLQTTDFINPMTGIFDPRHMYGAQNQDVFRWPAIVNGTSKQNLATFIIVVMMPGIPMLEWGEEQAFYVLDNTASNYVFGRQSMTSATAWQDHGCYKLGNLKYTTWPQGDCGIGCGDDWNSLDHRDPAHPFRSVMKTMFEMRRRFPVLNDGFYVEALSKQTYPIYLPGSEGTATETGMWSVLRGRWPDYQDFTGQGQGNQSVWLVYQNEGVAKTYKSDCANDSSALIAPFPSGTTVKNMFYPFDEYTLTSSNETLGLYNSTEPNGCLSELGLSPWGYKAFVPIDSWLRPSPVITKFLPGHDYRLLSNATIGEQEIVPIEFHFSDEMDCSQLMTSLSVESTTIDGSTASIDNSSVSCQVVNSSVGADTLLAGQITTAWTFSTNLINVSNGVHSITVNNVTTKAGNTTTNAIDHFLLRVGHMDNPIVFPRSGNYSSSLLYKNSNEQLYLSHKAPGADKFRYSTNWASTWSSWLPYTGANTTIDLQPWSGTKGQAWSGEHVMVQYWGQMIGSSDHLQQGDLAGSNSIPRRYPHFFLHGSFNQFGYDSGVESAMKQNDSGFWEFDFMDEWPSQFQANVWDVDPNGKPDQGRAFGDIDSDDVLDLLDPVSLLYNVVNITDNPSSPYLGYRIAINDGDLRYYLKAIGSQTIQAAVYALLAAIPILTGVIGVFVYLHVFYTVKFNQAGVEEKRGLLPEPVKRYFSTDRWLTGKGLFRGSNRDESLAVISNNSIITVNRAFDPVEAYSQPNRQTILIATMEYDIEDWDIKIKIGGLGVMAQLMGKHLGHQNLIWVVPCVGGVAYPVDHRAEPMDITVLGSSYKVQVQYHVFRNITYVLLDAPVFRQQTKAEPYPPRMDDIESAIYYSAWNSCIAETMKRFSIDLYHINDYHGSVAPLHLLPKIIPVCLSLHNAEFQGLWPMRTPEEISEVSQIYNLSQEVVQKYVQFGEVFNLLHAGASYLRIHQKGFGAVGVSAKYGKRSFARYPIFWGLAKIGSLPNPDPTDVADWDKQLPLPKLKEVIVDREFEANRGALKRQAQEWAGLKTDSSAELFVFVGRWSMQKGVDLIADVFPAILEKHSKVQLICIGPLIDLYGKFAALKLEKLMNIYPERVYSKPEFTALPAYIFSGAEFALMPSRDEPFGLVAVEFGRKGALCVGSRVGGLGQMPGWWFTIESTTAKHLISQFKIAIETALACKPEMRAKMRAQSAKQRFPVARWKEDLGILQGTALKISQKQALKAASRSPYTFGSATPSSGTASPLRVWQRGGISSVPTTAPTSTLHSRAPSPSRLELPSEAADMLPSLGKRRGPGHIMERAGRLRNRGSANPSRANSVGSHPEGPSRPSSRAPNPASRSAYNASNMPAPPDGSRLYSSNEYTNEDVINFVPEEYTLTREQAESNYRASQIASLGPLPSSQAIDYGNDDHRLETILSAHSPLPLPPNFSDLDLSRDSVIQGKKDYKLQIVEPFFTDPTQQYSRAFIKDLDNINGKSSEDSLCIETYLVKSEKEWFNRFHNVKMGKSGATTPASSVFRMKMFSRPGSIFEESMANESVSHDRHDQFLLQDDYEAPTGLRRILHTKIRDWPIYTFLLAFGQIIAANSYQITLLTGEVGQTGEKLFIVATIYLVTSILWWTMFRTMKSKYVLSIPFLVYGLAFFILGLAPYSSSDYGREWVQNVATGLYATASSSGAFFFSLNFGSEGSANVATWNFRACVIQGTQQIYVAVLWYWGSGLMKMTVNGVTTSALVQYGRQLTAITTPIAILMWAVAIVLFLGLPDYYRQTPGQVPSFYKSIMRRKIILWFFITVLIQNYFLSAPYGRNWSYLWTSRHAPTWAVAILVIIFFVLIWAAFLTLFANLSTHHSWILPLFAISLGAPRWCQMLWGTSGMGLYIPWAGSPVAGALVGRTLWLWLGVLDALQGVGFGMILLQTMTRYHITFTLVCAQVLGSLSTIVGRASSPDRLTAGSVFPNLAVDPGNGLRSAWFWIAMFFQLIICVGFFKFFRKEQLQKP